MADLEGLLRSAQAAMTAASETVPSAESAALKLRRPTRWRPPEQVLWRRPRSVLPGGSGGGGCAG